MSVDICRKLRQEDGSFKTCLGDFVRSCLKKIQKGGRPSVVVQTCDPSTREVEGRDRKCRVVLRYLMGPSLEGRKQTERLTVGEQEPPCCLFRVRLHLRRSDLVSGTHVGLLRSWAPSFAPRPLPPKSHEVALRSRL